MTPNLETRARLIPTDPEPVRERPWWGLLAWGALCAGVGILVGRVWG